MPSRRTGTARSAWSSACCWSIPTRRRTCATAARCWSRPGGCGRARPSGSPTSTGTRAPRTPSPSARSCAGCGRSSAPATSVRRAAAAALMVFSLTTTACVRPWSARPQLDALGQKETAALRQRVRIFEDPALFDYLGTLVPPFSPPIVIVRDPTLALFSTPGGEVVVHTGLLAVAQTEAQLAALLNHEIQHVARDDAFAARAAAAAGAAKPAGRRVAPPEEFERRRRPVVLENAYEEMRQGRIDLARRGLERVAAAAPNEARLHLYYGELHRLEAQRVVASPAREVELTQARAAYERALALDPALAEAHRQLGLLYYAMHDAERARGELGRYLALSPSAPDGARIGEYVTELSR